MVTTKRYATFVNGKWRGDSYRSAYEAQQVAKQIPGAEARLKDGTPIQEEVKPPKVEPKSDEPVAPFGKTKKL